MLQEVSCRLTIPFLTGITRKTLSLFRKTKPIFKVCFLLHPTADFNVVCFKTIVERCCNISKIQKWLKYCDISWPRVIKNDNFLGFLRILRILLWKAATLGWKGLIFWRHTLGMIRVVEKSLKKIFGSLELSGRQNTDVFFVETWIMDFYVRSLIDWLIDWSFEVKKSTYTLENISRSFTHSCNSPNGH